MNFYNLPSTSFKSSTTTGDGSDVAFATKYYITANGSSAYRFAGAGVLNTTAALCTAAGGNVPLLCMTG